MRKPKYKPQKRGGGRPADRSTPLRETVSGGNKGNTPTTVSPPSKPTGKSNKKQTKGKGPNAWPILRGHVAHGKIPAGKRERPGPPENPPKGNDSRFTEFTVHDHLSRKGARAFARRATAAYQSARGNDRRHHSQSTLGRKCTDVKVDASGAVANSWCLVPSASLRSSSSS